MFCFRNFPFFNSHTLTHAQKMNENLSRIFFGLMLRINYSKEFVKFWPMLGNSLRNFHFAHWPWVKPQSMVHPKMHEKQMHQNLNVFSNRIQTISLIKPINKIHKKVLSQNLIRNKNFLTISFTRLFFVFSFVINRLWNQFDKTVQRDWNQIRQTNRSDW